MDSQENSTQNELKIIVVGNSGTGKTSYVNKWIKNEFNENYKATVVSEFSYKIIEYKSKHYKIQLWDLAGMDQNICITKIFSKDSHGCIVLSDITNPKTLEECVKWKNSVDDSAKFLDGSPLPAILIRNKVDLIDNEEDDNDESSIKEFCEKNNFLQVFKTSAKLGVNIDDSMQFLIGNIIDKMEKLSTPGTNPFEKDRKSLVLQSSKHKNEPEGNKTGGCC